MAVQKRRFRVTLERRVEVQDDSGSVGIGYEPVATVPAAIETLSGREYWAAKQINADVSTRITIAYRRGINETWRVRHLVEHASPAVFDFYDVLAVIPDKKTGRTSLELLCTNRHAEGWRSGGDALTGGPAPPESGITVDWSQLTNVPTEFPPEAHTHAAADVVSGTFAIERISAASVTQHQAALSIAWSQLTGIPAFSTAWDDITGKPATFPPSAHVHDTADVTTGTFADARIAAGNVTQHQAALSIGWAQLTGVPSTFTPAAHVHAAADVTSGTFADARISVTSVAQWEGVLAIDWAQLDNVPSTFTPSAHVHAAADITSGTFDNARVSAGNVTQHQAALSIGWAQLTGVPSTFTPSAHTHDTADVISGTFANARISAGSVTQHQAALAIAWGQLTGVPLTFAPSAHVHDTADITTGTFANARIAVGNVTQHQASIDHGSIAGLSDDDHTQYILVAGTRAFTGTQQTQALTPSATNTYAVGTTSLRYTDFFGQRLNAVVGTPSTLTNTGTYLLSARFGTGTGTKNLSVTSASLNSVQTFVGSINAGSGQTAAATLSGSSHTFFGNLGFSSGANATLTLAGVGNFASAVIDGAGTLSTGANDEGVFLHGRVSGGLLQSVDAYGSFVQGFAVSSGAGPGAISVGDGAGFVGGCFAQGATIDGQLKAGADGAFAQGYSLENCLISASGLGAMARGYAADGDIIASQDGAVALGIVDAGFDITASGHGSLAIGDADTAAITASASNAAQFGPGTNAQSNSLKIGAAGLRLKGTTGAPGTPVNGDIYVGGTGNAFVTIHSNAKAVQINTGEAAWTTGAHATLRNFTATTTAAQALQLLETLVEELKAANLIN